MRIKKDNIVTDDMQNKLDRLIASRDKAFANRTFEIELYWKRTVYFMTAIGAIITGIVSTLTNENMKNSIVIMLLLSTLLYIVSILWYMLNKGSKAWQERWEYIVKAFEEQIKEEIGGEIPYPEKKISKHADMIYLKTLITQYPDNFYTLTEAEKTPFERYSVSKVNLTLSAISIISSICLIFLSIRILMVDTNLILMISFNLLTVVILRIIYLMICQETLSNNFTE